MRTRYLKYDLIRITALCFVLLGHVSAYLVIHFQHPFSIVSEVADTLDCISAVCIPLFLMLSGSLLLDERNDFNVRRFFSRNYASIALILLFWLVFYAAWRGIFLPVLKGNPPDMGVFARYFLVYDGDFPHLWYLFMLLGIYLAIPVLRLFVKVENRRYILGILLFSVLFVFIPFNAGIFTRDAAFTVKDFMNKFYIQYISVEIIYPVAGWYLAVFPPTGMKKVLLIAAGAAAACVNILSVDIFIDKIPNIMGYMISEKSITMLLYSTGLFVFIVSVCRDRPAESRVIRLLSDASFGIYITHVLILEILVELVLPFEAFHERFPLLYILTVFAVTGLASLCIVLPLSRIRGIRKLLHYGK